MFYLEIEQKIGYLIAISVKSKGISLGSAPIAACWTFSVAALPFVSDLGVFPKFEPTRVSSMGARGPLASWIVAFGPAVSSWAAFFGS